MPFPGSKAQLAAKPEPAVDVPPAATAAEPDGTACGAGSSEPPQGEPLRAEACPTAADAPAIVDAAPPSARSEEPPQEEGDIYSEAENEGPAEVAVGDGLPTGDPRDEIRGDSDAESTGRGSECLTGRGNDDSEPGNPVYDAPAQDAPGDGEGAAPDRVTDVLATVRTKDAAGEEEGPKVDRDKLQAERVRLKQVVHKFVARALAGSPCTLVADSGRVAVKYCIDSALETFSLVSAIDMSRTLIACRIANIEDVYSIADDGTGPFPASMLARLLPDELKSLLMIVFRGPQRRLYRFCMLEDTDKTCAGFLEALSCLHMYAQPEASKLRQQVAEEHSRLYCQGGDGPAVDLHQIASGAADAALSQQASVGFFLRCAGVRGGKGPLGALMCKATKLSRQVTISPLQPTDVPTYLGSYGYAASSATLWRITPAVLGLGSRPRLDIGVSQHIQVAGHTWYMVECIMTLEGQHLHPRLAWQVPRRLAHLRQDLHGPVKSALGKAYSKHFSGSHFAKAGGVPGTTAALHKWCSTLAAFLRSGAAAPSLVALVLRFMEAPSPELPSDAVQQESAQPAP